MTLKKVKNDKARHDVRHALQAIMVYIANRTTKNLDEVAVAMQQKKSSHEKDFRHGLFHMILLHGVDIYGAPPYIVDRYVDDLRQGLPLRSPEDLHNDIDHAADEIRKEELLELGVDHV